jgi:Protein of unknown function (DUF1569)
MDTAIAKAEKKYGSQTPLVDHPILGPLRAAQWRKFHWVHGKHHLKQLQRALSYEPRASSEQDSSHFPLG